MRADDFHIPVLLNESIEYLINPELKSHIIVDCTLGGGGYAELICERIFGNSRLIAVDKDLNALAHTEKRLEQFAKRVVFVNGNFGELDEILSSLGIEKVTGIVMDLGLSSYQLDEEEGFSFMRDTMLDMRANKTDKINAGDVVNTYTGDELTRVFTEYGEIGNAERLSKAIMSSRKVKTIETTFDLVDIVEGEYRIGKKDRVKFLAKIFQALRIEVNKELENLEKVLEYSIDYLEKGGRIVVISYHSLEDRIVKNFLREHSKKEKVSKYKEQEVKNPDFKILTKKAVAPGFEEVRSNSKARSAKLRAAERI